MVSVVRPSLPSALERCVGSSTTKTPPFAVDTLQVAVLRLASRQGSRIETDTLDPPASVAAISVVYPLSASAAHVKSA